MKRHLLTAGGGLAGIFLTIALLMSGASVIQGRQSTATPEFTLETPDLADVPDLGGDEMSVDDGQTGSEPTPRNGDENSQTAPQEKSVRDIAPAQFGLPEEITTRPLERVEPRTPLSDAVAKPEPVPLVLRHPVALSAGLIQFDDRLLQLDGLVPQKADRVCGEAAKTWPCGVVARTAFRNFLRARALMCNVPKDGWQGTLATTCSVNNTDPAVWLAEKGWAEAQPGSPLEDKVEAARKSRLGFFGDDPRDFNTVPVPLTAVPEDTNTGANTIDQGL
jgi:hypothetical protein